MLEYRITEDHVGVRLDKFLKKKLDAVPPSHLFKMIRLKKIRVNGKRAQPEQALALGDHITVRGDASRLESAVAPTTPANEVDTSQLKVLFEDDWLMVIDKPSGMAVHPGSGIRTGTVVDIVRAYLGPAAVRNDFAASPAHRIDRETSGVLIVAKRRPAMVHFTDVFTHGKAKKRYLALAKGRMPKPSGLIDLPLAEHQQSGESKARRGINLQEARTRYRVLEQGGSAVLLSCILETGRTHQIRRHLASVGHPLAGDSKHGDFAFNRDVKARWKLGRLFLHAVRIEFPHPKDGQTIVAQAPLAPELVDVLKAAGLNPASALISP